MIFNRTEKYRCTKISEFNDDDTTLAPPIPAPAAIPAIAPETVVRLHL